MAGLTVQAANANRDSVPWILLTSHYPLYCSTCANIARANISAASWVGPEFGTGVGGALAAAQLGEQTAGAMQASMLADLEPLMLKYGVDIYAAGHQHQYESMFPVKHGRPTAKNFVNPAAPVHFLTGNGGPPGIDLFGVPAPLKKSNDLFHSHIVAILSLLLASQSFHTATCKIIDHLSCSTRAEFAATCLA
eukprot:COSAG03_NODE_1479_length_4013_cov_2.618804_3_plen_193_part_00